MELYTSEITWQSEENNETIRTKLVEKLQEKQIDILRNGWICIICQEAVPSSRYLWTRLKEIVSEVSETYSVDIYFTEEYPNGNGYSFCRYVVKNGKIKELENIDESLS